MTPPAPGWDFDYRPARPAEAAAPLGTDFIVATCDAVASGPLIQALGDFGVGASAERILDHPPLIWTRLRLAGAASEAALEARLRGAEIGLRYVASERWGTTRVAPPVEVDFSHQPSPLKWRVQVERPLPDGPSCEGRWFVRDGGGVSVDRVVCGAGAGTRIAVVDDDAAELEALALDAVRLVHARQVPKSGPHGSLMVAWAVGAQYGPRAFRGVAPLASPRLYCIPKPGEDVVSLPLAIVQAVLDGADVVLCATYVEGSNSPMLDDAFEFAARAGRAGRGTVIIMPTGREASSPPGSPHASWSLGLGEPASDPRVLCVAPGSRDGGWFLWRARNGRLRPFSNRGPSVCFLAPGDDLAHPFSERDRLFHAESSGASAVAAGTVALVLSRNPQLSLAELHALLAMTASPPTPATDAARIQLADPFDSLPLGRDGDGHDAKHGYGLLQARRACLAAQDPFCCGWVMMGEERRAMARALHSGDTTLVSCSPLLARWAARVVLVDASVSHAVRVLLRNVRLILEQPERIDAHGQGALLRLLVVCWRAVARSRMAPDVPDEARTELLALQRGAENAFGCRSSLRATELSVCEALAPGEPACAPQHWDKLAVETRHGAT